MVSLETNERPMTAVHTYVEQYVETATKGKVEVEWALHVSRMRLICNTCCTTLTAPERPDSPNT